MTATGYTGGDPTRVDRAGDTMTGPLILEDGSAAASEQYVADHGGTGGGAVDSVNGQTGTVVLDATDVGAATPAALEIVAEDLTAHEAATTSVHGITATNALETTAGSAAKVSAHTAATDPHGDRAYTAAAIGALGLGTASTHAAADFDPAGSAATAQTAAQTFATTAAGNAQTVAEAYTDTAVAARLAKSANLSDLANAGTARSNLGLGSAATQNGTAFDASGAAAAAQAAAVQRANHTGAQLAATISDFTAAVNALYGTFANVEALSGGSLGTGVSQGTPPVQCRMQPGSITRLQGNVTTAGIVASGSTLFTLPTGYRPAQTATIQMRIRGSGAAQVFATFATTGVVSINAATAAGSVIDFDDITFVHA